MPIPSNLSPSELLAFVIEWLVRALAEWKAMRLEAMPLETMPLETMRLETGNAEQPGLATGEAGRPAGGSPAKDAALGRSAPVAGAVARRLGAGDPIRAGESGDATRIAQAPTPQLIHFMLAIAGASAPAPSEDWRGGAIRAGIV